MAITTAPAPYPQNACQWLGNAAQSIRPEALEKRFSAKGGEIAQATLTKTDYLDKMCKAAIGVFEGAYHIFETTDALKEGSTLLTSACSLLSPMLAFNDFNWWVNGSNGKRWDDVLHNNPMTFVSTCGFQAGHFFELFSFLGKAGVTFFESMGDMLGNIKIFCCSLSFKFLKTFSVIGGGICGIGSFFYGVFFKENWTPRTDLWEHLSRGELNKIVSEAAWVGLLNSVAKIYLAFMSYMSAAWSGTLFFMGLLISTTNVLKYMMKWEADAVGKEKAYQAHQAQLEGVERVSVEEARKNHLQISYV